LYTATTTVTECDVKVCLVGVEATCTFSERQDCQRRYRGALVTIVFSIPQFQVNLLLLQARVVRTGVPLPRKSVPSCFTWIAAGRISPIGQRLAAQLYSPGSPPISVVYEDAQEVERFPGFGLPNWIDDDTLVFVGSKLVTARIGGEPTVINDEVTVFDIGNVAVSPDGSRLVFQWRYGLWIMHELAVHYSVQCGNWRANLCRSDNDLQRVADATGRTELALKGT